MLIDPEAADAPLSPESFEALLTLARDSARIYPGAASAPVDEALHRLADARGSGRLDALPELEAVARAAYAADL
ncbi:hypothetical protein [Agromyces archimandritae]|uniref:Uncharacterized protein n=1 Tax=Agromyces archimandritae TaxID=2781962 RepID=A0A975INS5_9MICO|nr:hypothetical protein [Agromyces archimandritae]QTX04549.1 hypothetical protein G127AT_15010 [Agromyces archimandritae]